MKCSMPQTPEGRLKPGEDLKRFSCLTCRQRKVKCDRVNPCSQCMKAVTQCSFIAPVRGKRKSTKKPKEGLHSKLKRYEEMLKGYGAKIELSDDENLLDGNEASEDDVEMAEAEGAKPHKREQGGPYKLDRSKSRLVSKNGSSRYFDKYVCSSLKQCTLLNSRSELWSNIDDEVSLTLPVNDISLMIDSSNILTKRGSLSASAKWMFGYRTSLLIQLTRMAFCSAPIQKSIISQAFTFLSICCKSFSIFLSTESIP